MRLHVPQMEFLLQARCFSQCFRDSFFESQISLKEYYKSYRSCRQKNWEKYMRNFVYTIHLDALETILLHRIFFKCHVYNLRHAFYGKIKEAMIQSDTHLHSATGFCSISISRVLSQCRITLSVRSFPATRDRIVRMTHAEFILYVSSICRSFFKSTYLI